MKFSSRLLEKPLTDSANVLGYIRHSFKITLVQVEQYYFSFTLKFKAKKVNHDCVVSNKKQKRIKETYKWLPSNITSTNELPLGFLISHIQKYEWLRGRLSSLIFRLPTAALTPNEDGKTFKIRKTKK